MTEGSLGRPAGTTFDRYAEDAEDVDPLIAVAGLAFVADEVQQEIARLVRYCRSSGRTWTQIGHALGVSKQAAWERYSGED